jgi:hypothetical protein
MAFWNSLQTFGTVYDHLVHFVCIWYIFTVLVSCTKKNWQPWPRLPRPPNEQCVFRFTKEKTRDRLAENYVTANQQLCNGNELN